MSLEKIDPLPVPMKMIREGAVRIGGTRVSLDQLMWHFDEGRTPEEIVEQLPVLNLADVYIVRAFCLLHEEEVREYLKVSAEIDERIWVEHEAEFGGNDELRRKIYERARKAGLTPAAPVPGRRES